MLNPATALSLQDENRRLKRELEVMTMERDIIKETVVHSPGEGNIDCMITGLEIRCPEPAVLDLAQHRSVSCGHVGRRAKR